MYNTTYYEDENLLIQHGECIALMKELPDNCIDSIVTDPPYGLGFMGKGWDALPPGLEWAEECLRVLKPGGHLLAFGGTRTWHRLAVAVEDAGFEIRDSIAWMYGSGFPKHRASLKPAFEPIVSVRKPFNGSMEKNEAEHGTGALNIDACRVEGTPATTRFNPAKHGHEGWRMTASGAETAETAKSKSGRWPANVVLDEGIAETFPESKFFYVAKASTKERPKVGGVSHPTVKPLTLMRWLVKLVTPEGGLILDPFLGSGTTAQAALEEGFRCIGMEMTEEYLPLIADRLNLDLEEEMAA
jgi:site-specific DNA-methyltransferase (adenine-specific)